MITYLQSHLNIDKNSNHLDQLQYILNNNDWGEERFQIDLFINLLKKIKSPKPSLIELGSGGIDASFYSIFFEKFFNYNCDIICTEPREAWLKAAKDIWKDLHLINCKMYCGYTGENFPFEFVTGSEKPPRLKILNLLQINNLKKLNILHADIQGAEIFLCDELEKDNLFKNIQFIFINTHPINGENSYYKCKEFLIKNINCKFHYDHPLQGGYGDGLIVAENLDFTEE
jgi:hypothetical protein